MISYQHLGNKFKGFTEDTDLSDPDKKHLFSTDAELWVDSIHTFSEIKNGWTRVETHDMIVRQFSGEAREWYEKSFSQSWKGKFDPFNTIIPMFKERYCHFTDTSIPLKYRVKRLGSQESHTNTPKVITYVPSVEMLVNRIEDMEKIISDLQATVKSQNSTICELEKVVKQQQSMDSHHQESSCLQSIREQQHDLQELLSVQKGQVNNIVLSSGNQQKIIDKLQADKKSLQGKVDMLEKEVAKISISKCDTLKSLKHRQEHLQKEIATMQPVPKVDTSTLEKKLICIEQDCTAHKQLLDELQKQLLSLSPTAEQHYSVNSVRHIPALGKKSPEEKTVPCGLCGSGNHSAATCGATRLRCRQCLQVGHLARCCPNMGNNKQCYRCGLQNHTSDQCGAFGQQCWRCGLPGHLLRMCPHQSHRYPRNNRVS